MSKILKRREVRYVDHFQLEFRRVKQPDSGYGFDCTEDGTLLEPEKAARVEELRKDNAFVEWPVTKWQQKKVIPGELLCNCGRMLALHGGGDFQCECGQFYNTFGQELRHPKYWGEETGERFDDNGNYIGGGEY